jgi:Lar family restriction alleviation protein
MSAPELKPCPFCGGYKIDGGYNDHGGFVSICANCDAFGPPAAEISKDAILGAWNTRAADPLADPRVRALEPEHVGAVIAALAAYQEATK